MAHYLDPKNDLIFKRIFGEHKHLCMSLLNSMLPLEASRQIVELEYQQPELTPEIPVLKDSIVDVRCKDNFGRHFIVEMQMHWTDSFKSRVLFNASKAYVRQLKRKGEYKLLQPVYALSFINETFDPDPSVFYHDYKIVNIEHTEKRIEGLELVFIELPKFRPGNKAEKRLYNLWLTFLTQVHEDARAIPPELLEEEITKEAVQYLESSSYTQAQLEMYDRYWDSVRTQRTYILDALDEGEAIGLQKGKVEGLAEGEAIGLQKGKVEGLAEGEAIGLQKGIEKGKAEAIREMALSAQRGGFSMAHIQAITGLRKEEIEQIMQQKG
ncbi:MAG: Rpn family recombination-promoting nuclease/putative transposase [Prevotellaceae bacterium]|jgi:predicted transposase/invertase (TIGR01784 family)|nr:Rpn family recombination-promoting nuclease/putative transposase [Prevotellaceae bacterium]